MTTAVTRRRLLTAAFATAVAAPLAPGPARAAPARLTLPRPTGPHPVGTVSLHLIDRSSRPRLRDTLGTRFIAGVAFSTGQRSYTYEDRIHIMPVDRLWTPVNA